MLPAIMVTLDVTDISNCGAIVGELRPRNAPGISAVAACRGFGARVEQESSLSGVAKFEGRALPGRMPTNL